MKLSSYKLLKKSYSVRKLFDIFSNSSFVVVLHFDNVKGSSFKKIRKQLEEKGVYIYLLNKDDFLNVPVNSVSRGSSILFYSSEYFFYPLLNSLFVSNNLKFTLLYFKYYYPLSGIYIDQLLNKYKCSSYGVNSFFFFVLNSHKNMFLLHSILIKKYYISFSNVLTYNIFNFFLVLGVILDKKKLLELRK